MDYKEMKKRDTMFAITLSTLYLIAVVICTNMVSLIVSLITGILIILVPIILWTVLSVLYEDREA